MKTKWLNILLVVMALAIAMGAIVGGAYFGGGLDIAVGAPSTQRIRAPHVLENAPATERNRLAALEFAQNLEPQYSIDPTEWQFVDNNLLLLRADIEAIRVAYEADVQAYAQALEAWELAMEEIQGRMAQLTLEWDLQRLAALGTGAQVPPPPDALETPPIPEKPTTAREMFQNLHMQFSEDEETMLITMESEDFNMTWAGVFAVAETLQLGHFIHEIDFIIERGVNRTIATLSGLDRATEDLIEHIVINHLRPNVAPDEERNLQRFYEHSNNYNRVWIQPNQIIVDEGEVVTEDIYALLAQIGMLRTQSMRENIVPLLGVLGLVLFVFAISIMYLAFYCPTKNKKEGALLFTIFVLTIATAWAMRDLDLPVIALMIFPMLASLLIDKRSAIVLSVAMVLICFFVVEGGVGYLLFYTLTAAAICIISRFTTERNKIFVVGMAISAVQFTLYIIVVVILERSHAFNDHSGLLLSAGLAAASGMLTVILCTGSLPFWETFFGVVTPVKLLDLTNPTNTLLRRLTIEAPGTYHHSLIVANLAEEAAYDIGANSHAARVGAYYHDIGKLKRPMYFAENQDGENPHNHLSPTESVEIIKTHVTHGLTLANNHRLPQFVKDIIVEHQGTTKLAYFYAKAKEADPDINEDDYRYPGVIPQSRESACVMLADSTEAAVRATMPKLNSVEEVRDTIRAIIHGKLNDGQLTHSQLTIKDLTTIEESFFRVLKGMHHERIAYPKAKG